MREDLEPGVDDDAIARELEADPAALKEYVDQLQIHFRLGVALREESITDAVLREIRYKGDSERFAKGVVGRLKQGGLRRRGLELLAALFVLAALGFFLWRDRHPTPAAGGGELLLVVGQIPLETGDALVKERLEVRYRVTVRTARDVRVEDAVDLVLISSTVDEVLLKDLFRDVPVPVLTWEPRLLYDLGMIPGSVHRTDWGTSADQTRVRTATGPVAVTSRPAPFSWGKARSDAVRIATVENDPEKAVIFRYDRGADMPGLKAPARRAALFLFDWTAMALTPEGWALFDDSVRWCKGD